MPNPDLPPLTMRQYGAGHYVSDDCRPGHGPLGPDAHPLRIVPTDSPDWWGWQCGTCDATFATIDAHEDAIGAPPLAEAAR